MTLEQETLAFFTNINKSIRIFQGSFVPEYSVFDNEYLLIDAGVVSATAKNTPRAA